jgi:thiamine biosynthesis lipoprotein
VSALSSSAADADAIATTLLTLPKEEAIAWADRHRVAARIVTSKNFAGDDVILTQREYAATSPIHFVPVKSPQTKSIAAAATSWPKDWLALITFTAPPRQLVRDEHFRSPYMAMWITDTENKPIRTLLLVGTQLEYQKDNYIWWAINEANIKPLSSTRSMSTSGSGIYKVFWDGTDDQYRPVPGGTYVLHVETSREHGKHTHRELTLDFSHPKPFTDQMPSTEEAGGLSISFYRP